LVVPLDALSVPQVGSGLAAASANTTRSFATAAPVAPDTTATVTVDVVIPSAGTLGGLTMIVTRLETAV
jgi:hypothetical protein